MARPIQPGAANCVLPIHFSFSLAKQSRRTVATLATVASRRKQGPAVSSPPSPKKERIGSCPCLISSRAGRLPLAYPLWFSFFVKGCDAFKGFVRFARLQVILQRKIDIILHRAPPKFFN